MVRGAPFRLNGYVIPPGIEINPSIARLHRRAESYPDPTEFRPERFLGDDPPDTYTWIPFGGGTRRCLGASFATFEMRVVISRVLARTRPRSAAPSGVSARASRSCRAAGCRSSRRRRHWLHQRSPPGSATSPATTRSQSRRAPTTRVTRPGLRPFRSSRSGHPRRGRRRSRPPSPGLLDRLVHSRFVVADGDRGHRAVAAVDQIPGLEPGYLAREWRKAGVQVARRPTSAASLLLYCLIDACIGSPRGRGGTGVVPAIRPSIAPRHPLEQGATPGLHDHQEDRDNEQHADRRADHALHHRLPPVLRGQLHLGPGRVDLPLHHGPGTRSAGMK